MEPTGSDSFTNGLSAAYLNATSTATSSIYNLGTIFMVPYNFNTAGCAGNASATDFGACVNAIYNAASTTNPNGITILVPAINVTQSQWQTPINFGNNGEQVSFDCDAGNQLHYGGGISEVAANATSTLFNFGNPIGHTTSMDFGCNYYGQASIIAAGNTNTATTTGVAFGGSYGAVNIDFFGNTVNGFGKDREIGKNAYLLRSDHNSYSGGDCSAIRQKTTRSRSTASSRSARLQQAVLQPSPITARTRLPLSKSGNPVRTKAAVSRSSIRRARPFTRTGQLARRHRPTPPQFQLAVLIKAVYGPLRPRPSGNKGHPQRVAQRTY